jgi:broad specificity phosphatase PhoE
MPPCPAPDTCRLYLLRHGATDNNLAHPPRLQGCRVDAGLSPEGFEQARQTQAFLAQVHLDAVFSSPLLRARQTAEAIAWPRGLEVQVVREITEVDVGRWEGRTWAEVDRSDPEAYRLFTTDAGRNPYMGGENLAEVQARVVPALERLLEQNRGRVVLAVAHNVVNRVFLAHLLGIPLARYRIVTQDNCGINLLSHREGKVRVVSVNGVFHLDVNRSPG